MRAVPPTPKLLAESGKEYAKQLKKRLDDYLKDQSVDAVHDVRTSIRRLQSVHRALPKKVRKEKRRLEYMSLCKEFFKANTPARDCDILRVKLVEECGISAADSLVMALMRRRDACLKQARKKGKKLRRAKDPGIDPDDLERGKIRDRFEDVLMKITKQLGRNVPIVLSDMTKLRELHYVRKKIKSLRYTLELSSNRKALSAPLKELSELQDILGEVRDNDIAVRYLRSSDRSNGNARARSELAAKRDGAYQKLVAQHGDRILPLVASF
jgi:CHAD domain-containing protein